MIYSSKTKFTGNLNIELELGAKTALLMSNPDDGKTGSGNDGKPATDSIPPKKKEKKGFFKGVGEAFGEGVKIVKQKAGEIKEGYDDATKDKKDTKTNAPVTPDHPKTDTIPPVKIPTSDTLNQAKTIALDSLNKQTPVLEKIEKGKEKVEEVKKEVEKGKEKADKVKKFLKGF